MSNTNFKQCFKYLCNKDLTGKSYVKLTNTIDFRVYTICEECFALEQKYSRKSLGISEGVLAWDIDLNAHTLSYIYLKTGTVSTKWIVTWVNPNNDDLILKTYDLNPIEYTEY